MTELLALIALVGWGLALSLWWSLRVLTLSMQEVKRNPRSGLAVGAAAYNVMGRYQLREAPRA